MVVHPAPGSCPCTSTTLPMARVAQLADSSPQGALICLAQGWSVGRCDVCLNLGHAAGPGRHGGNGGMAQRESNGRLRHLLVRPGDRPKDMLRSLHLRGRQTLLRSKTPDLIRQEFYGLMMAHFAVRGLMHEAALVGQVDPDELSFMHAVRVVRRTLPHFAALSPHGKSPQSTPPSSGRS